MARILQIRRGTSAQNNNFTGMSGEITFDTDAKTIRVHDGETLGGIPLARKDELNGGSETGNNFDINTVPDNFWQTLFAKFSPAPFTVLESKLLKIPTSAALVYIFNSDKEAKFVQVFLVCQTPDAGYKIGDIVAAFGIDDRNNPQPNTYIDENGLNIELMVNQKPFWVSHKDTGATTNITNDNWRVLFRVYC